VVSLSTNQSKRSPERSRATSIAIASMAAKMRSGCSL